MYLKLITFILFFFALQFYILPIRAQDSFYNPNNPLPIDDCLNNPKILDFCQRALPYHTEALRIILRNDPHFIDQPAFKKQFTQESLFYHDSEEGQSIRERIHQGQRACEEKDFLQMLDQVPFVITPDDRVRLTQKYLSAVDELKAPTVQDFAPIPSQNIREFLLYLEGRKQLKEHPELGEPQAWLDLLALPRAQRLFRTTWALYSLGNFIKGDRAHAYYEQLRQEVNQGAQDSLSLAPTTFKQDYLIEPPYSLPALYWYTRAMAYASKNVCFDQQPFEFLVQEHFFSRTDVIRSLLHSPDMNQYIEKYPLLIEVLSWLCATQIKDPIEQQLFFNSEAFQKHAKKSWAIEYLTYADYRQKRYEDAFQKVSNLEESFFSLWLKAEILRQMGKNSQAISLFNQLLTKMGTTPQGSLEFALTPQHIHLSLAFIAMKQCNYYEALEQFLLANSSIPSITYLDLFIYMIIPLDQLEAYLVNRIIPKLEVTTSSSHIALAQTYKNDKRIFLLRAFFERLFFLGKWQTLAEYAPLIEAVYAMNTDEIYYGHKSILKHELFARIIPLIQCAEDSQVPASQRALAKCQIALDYIKINIALHRNNLQQVTGEFIIRNCLPNLFPFKDQQSANTLSPLINFHCESLNFSSRGFSYYKPEFPSYTIPFLISLFEEAILLTEDSETKLAILHLALLTTQSSQLQQQFGNFLDKVAPQYLSKEWLRTPREKLLIILSDPLLFNSLEDIKTLSQQLK